MEICYRNWFSVCWETKRTLSNYKKRTATDYVWGNPKKAKIYTKVQNWNSIIESSDSTQGSTTLTKYDSQNPLEMLPFCVSYWI